MRCGGPHRSPRMGYFSTHSFQPGPESFGHHYALFQMKRTTIPLLSVLLLLQTTPAPAADPAWWATRGVTTTAPQSNLSPATLGQAKHMVSRALAELQPPRLPSSEYTALQAEVAAIVNLALPVTAGDFEKQRAVLLVGEVKALAKPFYDRLRSLDPAWLNLKMHQAKIRVLEPGSSAFTYSPYPWSVFTGDDTNKAVATVGQLKAVFSLPFEIWVAAGPDYIPLPAGLVDTDGDGISDLTEGAMGTSPVLADTDADGYPDGNDAFPNDPSRWQSNPPVAGDLSPPSVIMRTPASLIYVAGP